MISLRHLTNGSHSNAHMHTRALASLVRGWWVGDLQTASATNNNSLNTNINCIRNSNMHTRSFAGLRYNSDLWEEPRRLRKVNPPPPVEILKSYVPPGTNTNVRKRFPPKPKDPFNAPSKYCPTASLEIHQGTAARLKSDEELEAGAFVEEDGKKIKIWKSKQAGGITKRIYHFLRFNGPSIRDLIYSEFQEECSKTRLTQILHDMRKKQDTIYTRRSTTDEIKLKKYGQIMRVYVLNQDKTDPANPKHKVRLASEQAEFEAGRAARRAENLANREKNAKRKALPVKTWFEDRL